MRKPAFYFYFFFWFVWPHSHCTTNTNALKKKNTHTHTKGGMNKHTSARQHTHTHTTKIFHLFLHVFSTAIRIFLGHWRIPYFFFLNSKLVGFMNKVLYITTVCCCCVGCKNHMASIFFFLFFFVPRLRGHAGVVNQRVPPTWRLCFVTKSFIMLFWH